MTRKARYASGRKPKVLEGKVLSPNAGVASRYERRLRALIALMTTETLRGVRSLFAEPHPADVFALDAGIADQAKHLLASLQFKFNAVFGSHSSHIAMAMLNENADASEAAIKSSMAALAEGLSLNTGAITTELGDVFTASIAENVALIKSIPQQYLQQVQGEVYRAITSGNGLSELVPALQKYKGVTERRARLIASDQTRKSFANINRIKLQNMGVEEYIWQHSHGATHPRPLHIEYDGKVFRWDSPPLVEAGKPERAPPGIALMCKCRAKPIIRFNEG